MTARLRHIAISVPDPEKAAKFFEEAFGMTRAGQAGRGVYMSDGTINVALLQWADEVPGFEGKPTFHGIAHFGMWVDNLEEAEAQLKKAGATYLMGRPEDRGSDTFYEVKYKDINGVVFDVTHTGWRGAVKEVVPAGKAEAAE